MSSIKADTIAIGLALSLAMVAKALERITHHGQNLAKDAMFEREGVAYASASTELGGLYPYRHRSTAHENHRHLVPEGGGRQNDAGD